MSNTKKLISEIVSELIESKCIKLDKIILFGSRARDEFSKYSDWDILVILDANLSVHDKMEISKHIRKSLAGYKIDVDVIVKCLSEVEYSKEFIGSVVREALKEGVVL